MKFQFELTVGQNKFTISEEAESQADFFKKVSFFSTLPKTGPNGEEDLELVHRTTTKGHDYFSIVSKKADQEFKLGQSLKNPGDLFGKGWEPLYKPDQQAVQQQAAPQQQYQQPVPQQIQQPVQQPMPIPQNFNQVAMPIPQPVQQPIQQPVQQPVQQVQQAVQQPSAPTAPAAPMQNNAVNDVLSQFGITK